MTEWRPVVGFEDRYLISDAGQVMTLGAPGRGRLNRDRIRDALAVYVADTAA